MAFSKDGQTLAIYGSGGLVLYDLDTREKLDTIGSAGSVNTLKFSPNGGLLASLGDDGIILTEVDTQKKIGEVIPGNDVIFSPDSTIIAISDQNNATVLFDTVNGNQIGEAVSGSNPVFSPDGKMIATYDAKDTKINLWSSDTHIAINKEPIPGNFVRFSPDGKTMAVINSIESTSNEKGSIQITPAITLWNVSPLAEIDKGEIPIGSVCSADQPNCVLVAFSPDGKTLAYNDIGGIFLWDVAEHQQIGDPFSDASEVSNLAFIRNGEFLVLGDTNGFTTLWDVASRSLFGNSIPGLFQLDGMDANSNTFLIKNGEEWSLWKFDPEDWINELCAKVGRNLTPDEWVFYGFADTEPYRATCPLLP